MTASPRQGDAIPVEHLDQLGKIHQRANGGHLHTVPRELIKRFGNDKRVLETEARKLKAGPKAV